LDGIVYRIPYVILLILSLSVHEWAHAWSAWKLGDDTASRVGRMTLNPLAHIDPLGTLILPLLGIPFGWAKPVPVDPTRFRRSISMGAGMAITASATLAMGPALAVLTAIGIGLSSRFGVGADGLVPEMLWGLLAMNVGLAVFNLIPLPPLDGSRIVAWLMPYGPREQWHALERLAPFLLILIFSFGGRLVSGPVNLLGGLLVQLARLVA
jgi:Zn-dependent protease